MFSAMTRVVAVLAASAALNLQQAAPERATDLLRVTFAAVGTDGQPAADLKVGELAIKIDGRSREIRSLQMISVADPAPAAGAAPEAKLAPPPFGANSSSEAGRTLVLALDDESFKAGDEQPLRQAVDRFLTRLSPHDRISLVTMPYGGVKLAATTDHSRVRTALSVIAGRGSAQPGGSELACRTRLTLEALARYLTTLTGQDAPTAVIFVTGGLAAPRRDAAVTMAPGMCELVVDSFKEVGAAAGVARAQFYIVPPAEIMSLGTIARENIAGTGFRGSDNPLEGLEQLLGVSGGKLLNLGAAGDSAFDRILRESAAYYVAAVAPERSDRNNSPHQLDVRVARSGVEVRSARSITFSERTPGSRPASVSPRDMLSVTTVFRDLPMRAAAYPSFEVEGGQIRIVTLAEPVEPDVRFGSLVAALFDRDGKVAANFVAQASDLQRPLVVGGVTAPPGVYRLRVAAIDTTGRSGTADYEVDAALAATGPLKISSILLGLSRGGTFVPKLQFEVEPVVIGYVEMSGAPAGAKVTATLELADTINGPARIAVPLSIESGAANRYVGKGALPIGALPPGDYVVRATIALEGHPPTRVLHTLRKVKS
jgi:VWFA-related protein